MMSNLSLVLTGAQLQRMNDVRRQDLAGQWGRRAPAAGGRRSWRGTRRVVSAPARRAEAC